MSTENEQLVDAFKIGIPVAIILLGVNWLL
jgi:hypothetical protein